MKTPEQEARDMLERMDIDDAQSFTSGDLVELANLIARDRQARKPVGIANNGEIVFAQPDETRAIEPALTADEWKHRVLKETEPGETWTPYIPNMRIERGNIAVDNSSLEYSAALLEPFKVMALANDALSDDDPRKITREDVEALRWTYSPFLTDEPRPQLGDEGVTQSWIDKWDRHTRRRQIADKLAALLPPEG